MSYVKSVVLILLVLTLSTAFAKPKMILGDWESAGNDIVPGVPYVPSYDFRYNCQLEVQSRDDERVFAVAEFRFQKNRASYFTGKRLKWTAVAVSDEGELKELKQMPDGFEPDIQDITVFMGIRPSAAGDTVELSLQAYMAVHGIKIPGADAVSVPRDEERVKASVTIRAELESSSIMDYQPSLTREVKVICAKIK